MPSPFPGVDPYLEAPDLWVGLHNTIAVKLAEALSPRLPEQYIVSVEERVYLAERPDFSARADAAVVRRRHLPPANGASVQPAGIHGAARGVQVLTVALPVPDEIREVYLEVRTLGAGDAVTVIELLSPTNKAPGRGRRDYEEKRFSLLGTRTNLVEIDLIRAGQPMPSYVQDGRDGAPPGEYRILVARGRHRPYAEIYAFAVRDPIPAFPVPLLPDSADVAVALQPIVSAVYDTFRIGRRIDYRADPVPPLRPEDAEWADKLLRAAGLR